MDNEKRITKASKSLAVILSSVLLFAVAVGCTVAILITHSQNLKNVFTPAEVPNSVVWDGNDASLQNDGNVDAYIRAAVVVNWVEAEFETNIYGKAPVDGTDYTIKLAPEGNNWIEKDGFFYYTKPVSPGEKTAPLIVDYAVINPSRPNGCEVKLTVVGQSIQTDGKTADDTPAVTDAWSTDSYTVVVDTNRTLAIQENNP